MRVPVVLAAALVAAAAPARVAAAQGAPPATDSAAPGSRRVFRCDGRRVTAIDIDARLPNLGGIFQRSRLLSRVVQEVHVTTRDEVVRRWLVLEVGDRCTELRRAESERLLRAQPYLQDARVAAVDDGAGGVRLEVTTWDELQMTVGLGVTTVQPRFRAVKLGNANLRGHAVAVVGEWRHGLFYRDMVGGRITDYQVAGRPYQLSLAGSRRQIGHDWSAEFRHPFFTDLQRIAWRASAGEIDQFLRLRQPGAVDAAVQLVRSYWDVGGLLRLGVPGRLSLFGASVSNEMEEPGQLPRVITDTGIVAADSAATARLAGYWRPHRAARINALWGVRNVRFLRVTGFDALRGPQDVRIGFQFGTLFGRSLPVLGSDDDDIFVASDLFIANGTRRSYLAVQARGEGREDGDTRRWDGVLTSGRLAWYVRPASWSTMEINAEWAGGWRTRVPFQLGFSDLDGGVRGYRDSRKGGSQRAVVRAENRFFLGTVKQSADVGLAAFVDAGRLWAGDIPIGVDARPHLGAGIGILAAVPPGSKRLWRVDIAKAFTADPDARWELRLSSGDRTRRAWRDPDDVRIARERTVPQSVFNWP